MHADSEPRRRLDAEVQAREPTALNSDGSDGSELSAQESGHAVPPRVPIDPDEPWWTPLGPDYRKLPFSEGLARLEAAGRLDLVETFRPIIDALKQRASFLKTTEAIPMRAIRAVQPGGAIEDVDAAIRYCLPHKEFLRSIGSENTKENLRVGLALAVDTKVLVTLVRNGSSVTREMSLLELPFNAPPKLYRDTLRRALRKAISQSVLRQHRLLQHSADISHLEVPESDAVDVVHAAETAEIVGMVRDACQESGPAGIAALEYFAELGSRGDLAKKHDVTPDAIRHAEKAVRQIISAARRSMED